MKRAILVTAGTVAGLVSVLAYSPPGTPGALSATPLASGGGLGGPPAATSTDPATAAPAAAAPDGSGAQASPATTPAAGAPAKATKHPVKRVTKAAAPSTATTATTSATATKAAAATHAPAPIKVTVSTKAPAPVKVPTPTKAHTTSAAPVPAAPKDYTGSSVSYKYGTIQVAIRVLKGKITDAWAVTYPQGDSLPYSEMAIPTLRSQTIAAQSAHIAGASGASLTSTSWITSLTSALTKAGL